jgi:hypothetical protein
MPALGRDAGNFKNGRLRCAGNQINASARRGIPATKQV